MNATTPLLSSAVSDSSGYHAEESIYAVNSTCMKWSALRDAADAVATLAGVEFESDTSEVAAFLGIILESGGWRRRHAEQGIDDLTAVMAHGLAALLSIKAQGSHAPVAARALLREFCAARAAILAFAPPLKKDAEERPDENEYQASA